MERGPASPRRLAGRASPLSARSSGRLATFSLTRPGNALSSARQYRPAAARTPSSSSSRTRRLWLPEPESDLAPRLADCLAGQPGSAGSRIVGWRFDLRVGWSVRAGLKNGQIGGPYEAPSAARGIGGSIYLRWSDRMVSHGSL